MVRSSKCPVMMLLYALMAGFSQLIDCLNVSTTSSSNLKIETNHHHHQLQYPNQSIFEPQFEFSPEKLTALPEGLLNEVQVSLNFGDYNSTNPLYDQIGQNVTICYDVEDPTVAWLSLPTMENCIDATLTQVAQEVPEPPVDFDEFDFQNVKQPHFKQIILARSNFSIKGLFLGKTHVTVSVFYPQQDAAGSGRMPTSLAAQRRLQASVVRRSNRLQYIFVGTLASLLILANVLMGAQLNFQVVKDVLRRPFAPLIGFVCQYLFMPMMAYGLACLVFLPHGLNHLALGLFTTGCSPGGGASNGYTVLFDGNIDLSITMTFLSTLAALGLMPTWLYLVGRRFLENTADEEVRINIPYRNIVTSLFCLIVPLLLGVWIRNRSEKFAERANKILRPLLLMTITFICTFGVYANWYMFQMMTWRIVLGGMFLPTLGFAFGTLTSLLCGQPLRNIKAIAIETGIQNTGISIVLLQLSFGQPEGDMAAVVPVIVAMCTPPPLLIALAVQYAIGYRGKYKLRREKEAAALEASAMGMAPPAKNGGGGLGAISGNNEASFVSSLHSADSSKPLYPLAEQQA